MASRVITCPHCKEEVGDFLVEGDIEVIYDLGVEEYTVDHVSNEKYLCSVCFEDCTKEVFASKEEEEEDVEERERDVIP